MSKRAFGAWLVIEMRMESRLNVRINDSGSVGAQYSPPLPVHNINCKGLFDTVNRNQSAGLGSPENHTVIEALSIRRICCDASQCVT